MNRLSHIEQGLKKQVPDLRVGDTVRVFAKIREGDKERIQVFEGTMIARKRGGSRETITVRKISFGVGVEKIFPVHSPAVEKIDVLRSGRVRRAKLYYLREKKGRAARIEEGKSTARPKVAPIEAEVAEPAEEPETVQAETT
jgi:large subunit ribosomal protein L19